MATFYYSHNFVCPKLAGNIVTPKYKTGFNQFVLGSHCTRVIAWGQVREKKKEVKTNPKKGNYQDHGGS